MDSLDRTCLGTGPAPDAYTFIYQMRFLDIAGDGLDRTNSGTFRASDASLRIYLVFSALFFFLCRFAWCSRGNRLLTGIRYYLGLAVIGREGKIVRHPNAGYRAYLRTLSTETAPVHVELDLLLLFERLYGVGRADFDAHFTSDAGILVVTDSPTKPFRRMHGVVQLYLPLRSSLEGLREVIRHMCHRERVGGWGFAPLPEDLYHHSVEHSQPPLKGRHPGIEGSSRPETDRQC